MAKTFAWSYSALTAWESCPKRVYHTRIKKDWPDEKGEAARWGETVHKGFENRLKYRTPLPEWGKAWEPLCAKFDRAGDALLVEQKIALNANFQPVDFFARDVWVRAVADVAIFKGDKGYTNDWKGLPLDTPLPTPTGWTTMGDVAPGDKLLDSQGVACQVVGKSPASAKQCYEITFDDRTTVVCDDEHLWKLADGEVRPALLLQQGDKIPVAQPAQHEGTGADLPIDPYVLGLWLADGKHTSGEISKPDAFVFAEVARRGYTIGRTYPLRDSRTCPARTVLKLRGQLRRSGLLGSKRIPVEYLVAPTAQRIDLLRGLMDGDGNANPCRRQAVFTTTNKQLSDQVKQLAESLGQRVNQATTTQRGFGLTVTAYPLAWRSQHFNPFLLPRKADRIGDWGPARSTVRRVRSVKHIGERTTACVKVDSPDNTYLCTRSYIPTHNTGKFKSDTDQLRLSAAIQLSHRPHLVEQTIQYTWLAENKVTTERLTKADVVHVWRDFLPRVQRMTDGYTKNEWPAKPSGLCRAWCPVLACEHNGKRK